MAWALGLRHVADGDRKSFKKDRDPLSGATEARIPAYFIDGKNEDTADISNLFKVSKLKVF